ncbi:MAG: DUF922 domain-containing protein [Pseudomonadota bacterium]
MILRRRIILRACATLLLTASSAALSDSPGLTEDYLYFSVFPEDLNDLGPALLAAGTKNSLGPAAIAETLSRHDWSIDMSYTSSECRVVGARVTLEITYRLPRVETTNNDVKQAWDDLFPRILNHERQHKDIAYEISEQILKELSSLRPASDCDRLVENAGDVVSRLHAVERQRQRAFDERTIGSETEGIIRFEVYE